MASVYNFSKNTLLKITAIQNTITIIITYKLLQAFFTDPDSPSVVVYYLSAGELIDTKHPITTLSLIIELVKFQFHQVMIPYINLLSCHSLPNTCSGFLSSFPCQSAI